MFIFRVHWIVVLLYGYQIVKNRIIELSDTG